MPIIYEPQGKAREYCELAANLYAGCEHGCTYCYAPAATFKTRERFGQPQTRKDVIEKIKTEAHKYPGREILLCFTCDPYPAIDKDLQITRQAIQILHANKCHITVLTKSGLDSVRDFDILALDGHKYGATLTFTEDKDSLAYEPLAALPGSRIKALEKAKAAGIKTWASLEPVLDPAQTIKLVENTKTFVDLYKVGKWNHDKRAKEIDWRKFAYEIKDYFEKHGIKYYIKNDLREYMD